jgi:hypothetical protein
MKNSILLIAAIFTAVFTSCVKDNALTPSASTEGDSITYEFEIPAQTNASDRTLATHYFYLTNAQITGGYTYDLEVRRQSDNQIVWESGGWFTGNASSNKSLHTEITYRAFLTLEPAYPGYSGTIHWKLTRGLETCISEGDRNIPSNGAIIDPWWSCE